MARSDPQFNLRMPTELKEDIVKAAETSGRSMNSEITQRLEESFSRDGLVLTLLKEQREMRNQMVDMMKQIEWVRTSIAEERSKEKKKKKNQEAG